MRPRLGIALLAALLALAAPARADDTPSFTDWTAKSANEVTGTLLGRSVTLQGPIQVAGTDLDGGWVAFGQSFFAPSLPHSDVVATEVPSTDPVRFTLHFGAPVRDPVFHLGSLAASFTFAAGTTVQLVSSQQDPPGRGISVNGSTVTGSVASALDGNTDGNGTIRLVGTFQDVAYDASLIQPGGVRDGHAIQIGGLLPGPTTTTAAPPRPESGVSAVTGAAAGSVGVRRPAGRGMVPLSAAQEVPVGTVVDATKGTVSLVTAAPGGGTASASVRAGIFRIKQRRGRAADLVLVTAAGRSRACAGRRKGVVRRLVVRAKGVFRTVGKASVAKGRNATWSTRDRCDGTLTRVAHGPVKVRSARRTVNLRAGHSYLAAARLFGAKKRRRG